MTAALLNIEVDGYFLPDGLGGVYGQAMIAAGEGGPGRYVGARLGIAKGDVDVAVAHSTTENNAAGDDFKVTNVGGSYKAGDLRLLALWHRSTQTTREQTGWALGATYAVGATTFRASYVRADFTNSTGKVDYAGNQIAVGLVHALSKRTSVYATGSRVSNDKGARYVIPGGTTVAAGQGSRAFELGINHSF